MRKYSYIVVVFAFALTAACNRNKQPEPASPEMPPDYPQAPAQPGQDYTDEEPGDDEYQQPVQPQGQTQEWQDNQDEGQAYGGQTYGGQQQQQQQQQHALVCPVEVPGTTVTTQMTENGIVMVFGNTQQANVAPLRQRVRALSELHNQHQQRGMSALSTVQAEAEYDDVDQGARITFTTEQTQGVPQLRNEVRQHVARMQAGECPGMGAGRGASGAGDKQR